MPREAAQLLPGLQPVPSVHDSARGERYSGSRRARLAVENSSFQRPCSRVPALEG